MRAFKFKALFHGLVSSYYNINEYGEKVKRLTARGGGLIKKFTGDTPSLIFIQHF